MCNNRKKKNLFSIRTKLSYYKLAKEMRKTQVLMNEPGNLELSILDLGKL